MCHRLYSRRDWERETTPFALRDQPRDASREATPVARGDEPRVPDGVRAGDADRERVAEVLRNHAAAGRLDADELEARLERVYAAKYGADLKAVLTDLPREAEPRARSRRPQPRPFALAAFPLAIAALVAVAILTSAWWLMWLIWPLAIVLGPRRHYRRVRVYR